MANDETGEAPTEVGGPPTPAGAGSPVAPLVLGKVFAERYLVEELLGHGGMGAVYRVYDKVVRERVALKALTPRPEHDDRAIERLGREVRLARRIAHPNVARTFDLGLHESTRYLTMELVDGSDLRAEIDDRAPMEPAAVVAIAAQVASALRAAHEAGIIHRDLKPANVLVDRSGRVAITDFGIARAVFGRDATYDEGMVGTPAYMAPEQVAMEEIGAPVDVYALGILMFEMLTGRLPFEGPSVIVQAAQRLEQEPADPRQHAAVPESLARLISSCLTREASRRPEASEVLAALQDDGLLTESAERRDAGTEAAEPSADPSGPPEFRSQTPDYAIGTCRGVLVVVWRKETAVDGIAELGRQLRRLEAETSGPLGMVAIVEETAPPPTSEARKAMAALLAGAERIRTSAVVFEGTGFRAAIVRAFVAGLTMLVKLPFPHVVFGSVADAVREVTGHLRGRRDDEMTPEQLLGAIESMRGRYQM